MTTDTKIGGRLTGNMIFSSEHGGGQLQDEGIVRETIRTSLNALLNDNLSDEEIGSLGPVPVLEATVEDAQNSKCNCHAFWEHDGLTCSVFHVTNENPSARYTKLIFVREFEGLKMALVVEKKLNDDIENTELGIVLTGHRAGKAPVVMFKLSGEDAGLVLTSENFATDTCVAEVFPEVDRELFLKDKTYQEKMLRYFRGQLFGLDA